MYFSFYFCDFLIHLLSLCLLVFPHRLRNAVINVPPLPVLHRLEDPRPLAEATVHTLPHLVVDVDQVLLALPYKDMEVGHADEGGRPEIRGVARPGAAIRSDSARHPGLLAGLGIGSAGNLGMGRHLGIAWIANTYQVLLCFAMIFH